MLSLRTVAFPSFLAPAALADNGINCKGSAGCSAPFMHADNANSLATAMVDGLDTNHFYADGAHLACVNDDKICAFLQNTGGLYGYQITPLDDLVQHGCTACGSVPVEDNNASLAGILTFVYVTTTDCGYGSVYGYATVCGGN
jgi:hypothetical protein